MAIAVKMNLEGITTSVRRNWLSVVRANITNVERPRGDALRDVRRFQFLYNIVENNEQNSSCSLSHNF